MIVSGNLTGTLTAPVFIFQLATSSGRRGGRGRHRAVLDLVRSRVGDRQALEAGDVRPYERHVRVPELGGVGRRRLDSWITALRGSAYVAILLVLPVAGILWPRCAPVWK